MRNFMEIEEGPGAALLERLMRAFHRLDRGLTEHPDTPIERDGDTATRRAWQRDAYKEQALTAMTALGIDNKEMQQTISLVLEQRVPTELDAGAVRKALEGADRYVAHTDGSASYKAGTGGWGVHWLAIWEQPGTTDPLNTREREMIGGDPLTTNNRMEMTAVITALKMVPQGAKIEIVTDSEYVMKGATLWAKDWEANGWLTATGKPVTNVDLWKRLMLLISRRDVHWQWIKGHTGVEGNERADKLATLGRLSRFPITIHDPQPEPDLSAMVA